MIPKKTNFADFFVSSASIMYIFPFLKFSERSFASSQKIQQKLVLIRFVLPFLKQLLIPLGYVIFSTK